MVVLALLRLVANSLDDLFRRVNKRLEFESIAVLRDIVVHTEVYHGSLSEELLIQSFIAETARLSGLLRLS